MKMRVGISIGPPQLHLRVVWTRAALILVLIDDAGAARQFLTSRLEIGHGLGGKDRCAVMLRCCVVSFKNGDSSMNNRWSNNLFLDDWLNDFVD